MKNREAAPDVPRVDGSHRPEVRECPTRRPDPERHLAKKPITEEKRTLRAEAEARLACARTVVRSPEASSAIVHELQVHQIELEMQNDELRREQIALEEARARYLDLYDFAPVGYLTVDERGIIAGANLTAARLLGKERRRLVGRPFASLVGRRDSDRWHLFLSGPLLLEGLHDCRLTLIRGDGSTFDAHLSCERRLGGVPGPSLRVVLTDVTEQTRLERALRETEARLAAAIEGSADGFVDVDIGTGVAYRSDRYWEISGWAPGSREALTSGFLELVHPDDAARVQRSVQATFAGKADGFDEEYRLRSSRGAWTWVRARIKTVAWDASGHPARAAGTITDISDRREAEEEARAAWAFSGSTLDAMQEHICVLDEHGVILTTNASWRSFAEVNEGASDRVAEGVSYLEACLGASVPEEERTFGAGLQKMLEGRLEAFSHEYACNSPSTERWFVAKATRFVDRGRIRIVVSHQDVTKRKLAERALQESEARFRSLFENAPEAMLLSRAHGQILAANPAATKLFGWSEAELRTRGRGGVLVSDQGYGAAMAERDRTGWTQRDVPLVRADGTTFVGEVTSSVFQEDGKLATVIVRDVTQLRKMEAELRLSENRFRLLANETPAGVFQTGARGQMLFVNPTYMAMTGLTDADAYGPEVEKVIHPEDRERVGREWRAAVSAGRIFTSEYRHLLPDGHTFWVRAVGAPLRDAAGAVSGYVGALMDVTETRNVQAQLAMASRLAAMGTLVAGVAHEINNPLAGDIAAQGVALEDVRVVRDRLRGAVPVDPADLARTLDDVVEALEDAQVGARRVAQIVKDLTSFGRPDPRRRRLRLVDIVSDAMRWLSASLGRGATVEVENLGGPDVMASGGQIEQVAVNLLTNAVNARRPGSSGLVVVRLGRGSPGMARLEVVDQGTGIEPALLERIFEPFFTTREVGKGMGLGLAVSHAIVTAHGGTLTVSSAPGEGSTFRMELPAAPAEG
jgi:PAS domain S-box-containing protein